MAPLELLDGDFWQDARRQRRGRLREGFAPKRVGDIGQPVRPAIAGVVEQGHDPLREGRVEARDSRPSRAPARTVDAVGLTLDARSIVLSLRCRNLVRDWLAASRHISESLHAETWCSRMLPHTATKWVHLQLRCELCILRCDRHPARRGGYEALQRGCCQARRSLPPASAKRLLPGRLRCGALPAVLAGHGRLFSRAPEARRHAVLFCLACPCRGRHQRSTGGQQLKAGLMLSVGIGAHS